MKFLSLLLQILLLGVVLYTSRAVQQETIGFQSHNEDFLTFAQEQPEEAFKLWAQRNQKSYIEENHNGLLQNNVVYKDRFQIWLDNLEYVLQQNRQVNPDQKLAMNSLADLSFEEYRRMLGYRQDMKKSGLLQGKLQNKRSGFMYADEDIESLPAEIDWRDKDAVTAVKNQGYCGSCWAFSTTGSIEGANALFTKKLVSLSEQELVDCDHKEDQGCNGGLMDYAFEYIMENGGIDSERDYPYDGEQERCQRKKELRHVVSIDGYQDVPENSESDLLKAAANQPISVAIDAGSRNFQMYGGGVFGGACGTGLNHGVLVVGYGTQASANSMESGSSKGLDYWIVKNSWGAGWGDDGYIKMKRNVGSKGLCGIAMAPSYPIKTSPNPAPGPDPGPDPTPAPTPGSNSNECNDIFKCDQGQTCCCLEDFMGFCFNFGCCEYDRAVCCDDKEHCCPQEQPYCDTVGGSCGSKRSDGTIDYSQSVKLGKKTQAQFNFDWAKYWGAKNDRQ